MTVVYLDRVFLLNSVVDYLLFLCAAGEHHDLRHRCGESAHGRAVGER